VGGVEQAKGWDSLFLTQRKAATEAPSGECLAWSRKQLWEMPKEVSEATRLGHTGFANRSLCQGHDTF
jgi:hypothetical protein